MRVMDNYLIIYLSFYSHGAGLLLFFFFFSVFIIVLYFVCVYGTIN